MNILATTLDPASTSFLASVMGSAPFDHETSDKWFLSLYHSSQPLPESLVVPNRAFLAEPVKVDTWYDSALGRTNLVLVVRSKDIDARFHQIEAMGYPPVVPYSEFIAHLTLVWGIPGLSRANKAFINSLNMTFNRQSGNILGFQGEFLLDDSGYSPNVEGQKFFVDRRQLRK